MQAAVARLRQDVAPLGQDRYLAPDLVAAAGLVAADALAALIVGVVIALIAWGMISRGLAPLRGSNLKLERTADSLRRDAAVIKETRP